MWTKEVIEACQALIKADFSTAEANFRYKNWINIRSAYDGVVFQEENGDTYKYFLHTKEVRKLPEWRKGKIK